MTFDPKQLMPAPWEVYCESNNEDYPSISGLTCGLHGGDSCIIDINHANFIALARNAFDVMMRRGWIAARATTGEWVVKHGDGLAKYEILDKPSGGLFFASDPFTAIVEADRWWKEYVES